MRRTIGSRSSPRNMCSVRHSPMPSAPRRRALAASGPLSALARTPSRPRRISSAHARIVSNDSGGLAADERHRADARRRRWRRRSRSRRPRARRRRRRGISRSPISSRSAPTTAGLPQPRATHRGVRHEAPPRREDAPARRACRGRPPGDVSVRTRMTSLAGPCRLDGRRRRSKYDPAHRRARRGAEARGRPRRPAPRRTGGAARCRGASAFTRWTASARLSRIDGSSTISTAMRSAARPVRLPTRVCSIQSLSCSIVNSMSHMSR